MIRTVPIPRMGRGRMGAAGEIIDAQITSAVDASTGGPLDSFPGLYTCDGCGGQMSSDAPNSPNTAGAPGGGAGGSGALNQPGNNGLLPAGLGLELPDFLKKYATELILIGLAVAGLYLASQRNSR